ncbi:MAG TPA: OB-fold domain-containing protein [Streptosporangiaceae bacterium]
MSVGPVSRDEQTAVFFDGTAAGEFRLRRCARCRGWCAPQAVQCEHCGAAELDWQAAGGGATLVSWTVAHSRPAEDGTTQPVVLVIGQLDEGPWWWSQLTGASPDQLSVGARLRIRYQRGGPDAEAVPVFALAAGPGRHPAS